LRAHVSSASIVDVSDNKQSVPSCDEKDEHFDLHAKSPGGGKQNVRNIETYVWNKSRHKRHLYARFADHMIDNRCKENRQQGD